MKTFSEFMNDLLEEAHEFTSREKFEKMHPDKKALHVHHLTKKFGKEEVATHYKLSDTRHANLYGHGDYLSHSNYASHRLIKKESIDEDVQPLTHHHTPEEPHHFEHGNEVKINKPGHPMHGKTGYIGHTSTLIGHPNREISSQHSGWEAHDHESEHHSVQIHNNGSYQEKDAFRKHELQHTGKTLRIESSELPQTHTILMVHPKTMDVKAVAIHGEKSDQNAVETAKKSYPEYTPHKIIKHSANTIEENHVRTRKVVVRFRNGKRTRKLQCPQGQRAHGTTCVRQSSQEKQHRKQGARKRNRTLRAKGPSARRRANFKRNRSLSRRHAQMPSAKR